MPFIPQTSIYEQSTNDSREELSVLNFLKSFDQIFQQINNANQKIPEQKYVAIQPQTSKNVSHYYKQINQITSNNDQKGISNNLKFDQLYEMDQQNRLQLYQFLNQQANQGSQQALAQISKSQPCLKQGKPNLKRKNSPIKVNVQKHKQSKPNYQKSDNQEQYESQIQKELKTQESVIQVQIQKFQQQKFNEECEKQLTLQQINRIQIIEKKSKPIETMAERSLNDLQSTNEFNMSIFQQYNNKVLEVDNILEIQIAQQAAASQDNLQSIQEQQDNYQSQKDVDTLPEINLLSHQQICQIEIKIPKVQEQNPIISEHDYDENHLQEKIQLQTKLLENNTKKDKPVSKLVQEIFQKAGWNIQTISQVSTIVNKQIMPIFIPKQLVKQENYEEQVIEYFGSKKFKKREIKQEEKSNQEIQILNSNKKTSQEQKFVQIFQHSERYIDKISDKLVDLKGQEKSYYFALYNRQKQLSIAFSSIMIKVNNPSEQSDSNLKNIENVMLRFKGLLLQLKRNSFLQITFGNFTDKVLSKIRQLNDKSTFKNPEGKFNHLKILNPQIRQSSQNRRKSEMTGQNEIIDHSKNQQLNDFDNFGNQINTDIVQVQERQEIAISELNNDNCEQNHNEIHQQQNQELLEKKNALKLQRKSVESQNTEQSSSQINNKGQKNRIKSQQEPLSIVKRNSYINQIKNEI